MTSDNILKVQKLNVVLGDMQILEDINFELNRGESLAIIGPNASGKSTLLKALLGLLPCRGKIIWKKGVKIGYVPQKVELERHLPLNLRNFLEAKAAVLKIGRKAIEEAVREVGIKTELLDAPIGHLSGGQLQKALIAFAILGNPEVVLFDEPTASLDQPAEEHTYHLIHRLQEERKLTVILVSHDISLVYKHADMVLCLNKQKLCFGEPGEVLNEKTLSELYGTHAHYHHVHGEK